VPSCQGSPERIDRQAYDNRTIRHPKPRSAQVSLIMSGVTSLPLSPLRHREAGGTPASVIN
jgi:hypothetical protein